MVLLGFGYGVRREVSESLEWKREEVDPPGGRCRERQRLP